MRKLCLTVVLLSCLVMLSAAAGSARTQPKKPPTGSASDFKHAQFDNPTRITNKWMLLKPGTQRVYEGSAILEGEKTRSARRVVATVTDVGKLIAGVRTLVVLEKDYTSGQLGETELAFFAQDNAGNV